MTEQFQANYAEVNHIRMHYLSAGQGEPIMFVHGFPEFSYAWKEQIAEFSKTHQVIAPDMRGYNLTDKPEGVENYHIAHLVGDLLALADHLGWSTFTLVAHDWGGFVAWWLAIKHPERLKQLIIINIPHPATFWRELSNNPRQQKASQYVYQFRSAPVEQFLAADNYAAFAEAILGNGIKEGYFTEADKATYITAWSQPDAMKSSINYYRAYKGFPGEPEDTRPDLSIASTTVTVPTLVIWGENDTALDIDNLNGLEEYVPNLQIKRIPDGTHWVSHKFPQLVNQAIREFIK